MIYKHKKRHLAVFLTLDIDTCDIGGVTAHVASDARILSLMPGQHAGDLQVPVLIDRDVLALADALTHLHPDDFRAWFAHQYETGETHAAARDHLQVRIGVRNQRLDFTKTEKRLSQNSILSN